MTKEKFKKSIIKFIEKKNFLLFLEEKKFTIDVCDSKYGENYFELVITSKSALQYSIKFLFEYYKDETADAIHISIDGNANINIVYILIRILCYDRIDINE